MRLCSVNLCCFAIAEGRGGGAMFSSTLARQLWDIRESRVRSTASASGLVLRLERERSLEGHDGCVNTAVRMASPLCCICMHSTHWGDFTFLLAFCMRQHVLWHFSTGCMHAHHLAIASHDMTPHKPDHRCISSMSAIFAFV